MRIDTLEAQLSTARHRLSQLQRQAEHLTPDSSKLLQRTLKELESVLEQLSAAQEQLLAQRDELSAALTTIDVERRNYWQLFDAVDDACLVTTADLEIVEANRAAAELLNISQRFLIGRSFGVFVGSDRARVLNQAARLSERGGSADWVFTIRPRERAPFDAACRVMATPAGGRTLRWMIRPLAVEEGSPRTEG